MIQVTFAARSTKALYFDSVLDRDTTFCFLEAYEINVSPRKTHRPAMDFLSSMLVAQSASENPAISRSIEGLIWRQKFVVPWRYLNILFIPY